MSQQSQVLYRGEAEGEVLRLEAPISFWGGINPATSEIVLHGHPQIGQKIANKILVVPKLIGSSSSSTVMLELLYVDNAPAALILDAGDAILPIGVVVAGLMGWTTIPVMLFSEPPFQSGERLRLYADGSIEKNSA